MRTFEDREEAGRLVGRLLERYREEHPVVLGIPRGGMVVARAAAQTLGAPLDFVLAHKLGCPGNPELAVGGVAEGGVTVSSLPGMLRLAEADLADEKRREVALIARRMAAYRALLPAVPLKGKTAIVVDDGAAMGFTMAAALRAVRGRRPARLVAAVPVASPDAAGWLRREADAVVCLAVPRDFWGVGQFYASFPPVTELRVAGILREEARRRALHGAAA
jgi:putative phosphoribosyl transferase